MIAVTRYLNKIIRADNPETRPRRFVDPAITTARTASSRYQMRAFVLGVVRILTRAGGTAENRTSRNPTATATPRSPWRQPGRYSTGARRLRASRRPHAAPAADSPTRTDAPASIAPPVQCTSGRTPQRCPPTSWDGGGKAARLPQVSPRPRSPDPARNSRNAQRRFRNYSSHIRL